MKKKQFFSREGTIPRWLKWFVWICCIIIVICVIYSIFLYKSIQSNKMKGFEDSKQIVLNETNVVEIDDIILSHSEQAYHVIIGQTKDKERKIVFVPQDETNEKLTIVNQQEIVSAQSVQQEWRKQCGECEFLKLIPAIVENEPMWELTYIDNNGRYIIDYLSIYDGTIYEQYRFRPMFK